ncbi:MAG: hypothetical protein DSM107014_10535 [Gomphosphaeria aponina SAG 52.96 = DSM 107014]|uniref:Uncharacterized protein n=1 Tax=Gomphosphaeria aponina SAG 52.96 = DSM 107014 TaxID=1521640 RepID=A0A941JMK3_9CHRO|nr:hypothetical protein [Gomphosphaeria aponina SAG 52.96 = DSM 107014]
MGWPSPRLLFRGDRLFSSPACQTGVSSNLVEQKKRACCLAAIACSHPQPVKLV